MKKRFIIDTVTILVALVGTGGSIFLWKIGHHTLAVEFWIPGMIAAITAIFTRPHLGNHE